MAVVLEEQRDLDTDLVLGIEQLVTIGWTSISTARSIATLVCWLSGAFATSWRVGCRRMRRRRGCYRRSRVGCRLCR